MSDITDAFWRAPPIARTLSAVIFVTSVAVYTGLLAPYYLYFHWTTLVDLPPQIWRLVTSYLLTQPKTGILLDPYFVFQYVSQLETGNPKFSRKEDVVWYLAFVSTVIIVVDSLLGWNSGFYLQGLILALAYTGTQDQRGVKANFFFLTVPAQLVPYTMILVTLLMAGPMLVGIQLCGLFAAHLHDFLTRLWPEFGGGSNWFPTPAFLSRLVEPPTGGVEHRAYGTAIRPGAAGGGAEGGGGPLPDAWRTRGKGQRLGGQ